MRRLFTAGCLRFETAGLDGSRESPRSGAKRKLEASQEAPFKEPSKAMIGRADNRTR